MESEIFQLLRARKGHFLLESGHHGELWLDLEMLCLEPGAVKRLAGELATRLEKYRIEVVCGPRVEGAFVGMVVALEMGVKFTYSERVVNREAKGLYPVQYVIPQTLRGELNRKRVAIVNDVINAGSAVRGTLSDLEACGAQCVVIGSLAVLGDWAERFAVEKGIALERLASFENEIWESEECPMCQRGLALTNG